MENKQLEFWEADTRMALEGEPMKLFSEVLKETVEYERGRGAKSLKSFIIPCANALNHFFGKYALTEITPQLIEEYQGRRRKEVTAGTVNRDFTILSIAFNRCIRNGLIKESPLTPISKLREIQKRRRYLHLPEQAKILAACSGMLLDAVTMALNTGMRRGELFSLRVQDIDFKANVIMLSKTKTDSPRDIPMNAACRSVAERRCETESDYLFLNRQRKPIGDLKASFKKACKAAGLTGVRFHDLRHTFATNLVRNGVPIYDVSALLGHSRVSTTQIYAKVTDTRKAQAVEGLERIFERPEGEKEESETKDMNEAEDAKRITQGKLVFFPGIPSFRGNPRDRRAL